MTTPPAGRPRVILLGASNLTRGISTVVRLAQAAVSQPAEFLIACGHGRSYGQDSTVLGRTLPGIAPCGLWDALRALPPGPTRLLVTDVGNDLLYGAPPEQIADWVGACLAQLPRDDTRVAMTGLPLAALATLQPWRFALLSRVFFPLHAISFEGMRRDALELNDRLQQLAARHDAEWIEPCGAWYGFDPIHIRMEVWEAAWGNIFWELVRCCCAPSASLAEGHRAMVAIEAHAPRAMAHVRPRANYIATCRRTSGRQSHLDVLVPHRITANAI
ncbi:MAG: hypothetical protein SGJ19_14005 [Planctomycetia bacterium]|nr:hypothetical protein [Planctomycetia bacterium]